MKDKKVIGLTGLYCAGKNHVALILSERGIPVLDADKLGHQVIETEKERITARFGSDILGKDDRIDRKLLGAKVFGRPGELAALEEIIHPVVDREITAWINSRKEKACVINAALLHRSSVSRDLDVLIIVEAPIHIRLLRAKKRDKLPWMALLERFRSQNEFNYQYYKEKTDIYRVSNSSGCTNSGRSGFRKRFLRNKLEHRIDEILSRQGIRRM